MYDDALALGLKANLSQPNIRMVWDFNAHIANLIYKTPDNTLNKA